MNYYIGAELNGSLLKVAAFKKSGQTFDLFKVDSITLPMDRDESTKLLRTWARNNLSEASSIKVVVTVSESTLYIKEMEFPKMPKEKLNEAIYWEIPSIAPIPQTDAVYDWQTTSEQKGNSNVVVIVSKNSYIQNLTSIFSNAQWDVVAIEPSSYAFARAANAPFDSNTLVCLVQEQGMDFIILKYGIPLFTTSTTGHTQSEKVSHIKSGSDLSADIVSEGKKIISYWEKKENLKLNQVVVSGDLVYKFFGLSASLNLFPPITTFVATLKKIKSLNINEQNDLTLVSYLISIGAGIRFMQKDVFEGINLFPQEEKQKTEKIRLQKKTSSQLMTFVYANVVVLVLLITTIVALNLWNYSLENKYLDLNSTLSTKSANSLIQEAKETNAVLENVIKLTKDQDDFGAKLKLISDLTPTSVRLTSVNVSTKKSQDWKVSGVGDRDSILAFHKIISERAQATEITMPYSNFNKPNENEFSISITW